MDQATNISTTSPSRFHLRAIPAAADTIGSTFIDQIVNINESRSLVDYVDRFKTDDTVIFADTDELEVHAVVDYHKAKSAGPGLAEHRAVLSLSHSAEWSQWSSISGRMYDQKLFALMLEINSEDIAQSEAASLLKTVKDLEFATVGAVLPLSITLNISVFAGEPKVGVKAMINGSLDCDTGKISLIIELVRARVIIEREFAPIANEIASATSVPVILGSLKD
jgi:Uncharacterized conserved protein (DUF2303)